MPRARLACVVLVASAVACGGGGGGPDAMYGVCGDGIDNEGDNLADFPADPGCDDPYDNDESNPPIAQCSDGRDNDGDGKIDYPNDPGCYNPLQNLEADDCPAGPMCPDCSNTQDDDGDSLIDYPADDGCSSAADNDEWVTNPQACGPGLFVQRLVSRDIVGLLMQSGSSDVAGACGGSLGDEVAYELVVEHPSVVVISSDRATNMADTVLYLRSQCLVESSEIACNDDISTQNKNSRITATLAPGVYYLVIDSKNTMGGMFAVHVDVFAGEGVECTMQSECGPGLQCRVPQGGTTMVCADPVCNDGVDDDGDGDGDYPDDAGCDSPLDFDEADDCPSGPGCPACANGDDDDGDGDTDYPQDMDCSSASQPVEGCGSEDDPIFTLTMASVMGDTTGLSDDFDLPCDSSPPTPDQVYFVVLPRMQSVTFDTIGSTMDTVLALYSSTCSGTAIACDDDSASAGDSRITRNNLAPGAYALVVQNYSTSFPPGPYNLDVSGSIAPLGRCDGALALSGAIECASGYACNGGVCTGPQQCADGMDNDGDGENNYPDDPGCTDPSDTDESDDCPSGPSCPDCGDGADNDGDGDTDYPADSDCDSASGTAEVCGAESDPLILMTTPTITGTTVGAGLDFTLSCGGGGGSAPDRVALVDLPAMESLHVDMMGSGYDAILALKTSACGMADIACHDGIGNGTDQVNVGALAAGTYAIVIDGWSTSMGPYTVNVSGRIAPNGRCEGALAQAGALTCADGYACLGAVGNKRCRPAACNDTMDNDGDGDIDYPADPGCTSASDASETDPGTLPVCADGMDNDGDGATDWPDDPGCNAASSGSEAFCAAETDPVAVIAQRTTTGTTNGLANNTTPSCLGSSNASDKVYGLVLPVTLDSLTIDTNTSGFDTVLTFDENTCTSPVIACDNDSGDPGAQSKITLTSPIAPGAYAITIDGAANQSGSYALHVRGVARAGSVCTSPLFGGGAQAVLVCPTGTTCTGGKCQ